VTASLIVHSSLGECDELPVSVFFRGEAEFFPFDTAALSLCRGRVLDVGAGTGVHSLALQGRGQPVRAAEVLPEAVRIMRRRGVQDIVHADLFDLAQERYDTLLMLMNGIGPVGTLAGLEPFLAAAGRLLAPGGQILLDSGEAHVVPASADAPRWDWPPPTVDAYVGEAWIRLQYRDEVAPPFRELYLDSATLIERAGRLGWRCELAFTDETGGYLACLRPG
jgi:SAM-dependent methyltransferase